MFPLDEKYASPEGPGFLLKKRKAGSESATQGRWLADRHRPKPVTAASLSPASGKGGKAAEGEGLAPGPIACSTKDFGLTLDIWSIAALAAEGKMTAKDVSRAIKLYKIDGEKPNPLHA